MRSDAPKISDSAGTAMEPPPMPSNPANVPMKTPASTIAHPVIAVRWIVESRDGVNHICEAITNIRNTA